MTKKRNTLRAPPKADAAGSYVAEIRFGVVMYGGVSLAVYINGVAQELFHMACATPRAGYVLPREVPGTSEIYERLAVLACNETLLKEYAKRIDERGKYGGNRKCREDVWNSERNNGLPRTRFAVDVISGTSAGGINGIFLASALANGREFGALKDLWIEEGDLSLLLNDDQSFKDMPTHPQPRGTPRSLLNSDRMYVKLRAALEQMASLGQVPPDGSAGSSPLAEQIDLFVTTTEVAGLPVALRLFDKVVYEKRHRQSFHFSYPTGLTCNGNDFAPANHPFLAFAARCTSSFPFAFEPMTLGAVSRLQPSVPKADLNQWQGFFSSLPSDEFKQRFPLEERAFGDGGYLDNAPFSYVVDTLAKRAANIPLERKLLYIEPSPKVIDQSQPAPPPPDALSNSIAALFSIPQYESIREDLENVLQRNRRIERVEQIVRQSEADLERQRPKLFATLGDTNGQCRNWASLKFSDAAEIFCDAFLPYLRLRTAAVTDSIAERLGVRWNIDPATDQQYALRALVRVWRDKHYNDDGSNGLGTTNAFLDEFDVDYRERQLGFLLRKIDRLTRLYCLRLKRTEPSLNQSDEALKARLTAYLPGAGELNDEQVNAAHLALQALKAALVDVRATLLTAQYDMAHGGGTKPETTRKELCVVLKLILGEQPSPKDPTALMLRGGERAVPINTQALDGASPGLRTLLERTFGRAEAIYDMASRNGRTELQAALEGDIESMRMIKATTGADAEAPLAIVARQAWVLLGEPDTARVKGTQATGTPVTVKKADSTAFGIDGGHERIHALDSDVGTAIRQLLSEYYLAFDQYDQISFPLYYDTDTGEPATVEVARVSPLDATNLIDEDKHPNSKLAGTAFGHFGAFLDRRWRVNDVMWGRLDGAERLIQVLLPGTDKQSDTVRKELIEIAQGRILREELVAGGHDELNSLICNALQDVNGGDLDKQIRHLLAQLKLGGATARDSMRRLLTSLLSEKGLLDFVRHARRIDRDPDPKALVDNVARAVSITGRMLDGISAQHGRSSAAPRWLARLGLFLQGIVAVSFPGSLKQRWWSHAVKILYTFELVALGFSLLLGEETATRVSLTAFGVTAFAHLSTMVVGDLMVGRFGVGRLGRAFAVLAVLAVMTLTGIGVAAVADSFRSPAPVSLCDACHACRPPSVP